MNSIYNFLSGIIFWIFGINLESNSPTPIAPYSANNR